MQVIAEEPSSTFDIPKSPIFKERFFVKNMFADLRSRCKTFLLCKVLIPKSS